MLAGLLAGFRRGCVLQPSSAEGGASIVQALTRRRWTVLFADLVESVRLFHDAERSVIERWHAFTLFVESDIATQHEGRLVRTAGDGLLMQFASSAQAVLAAQALHAGLARFNLGQPDAAVFWLRIGVHVADVVSFPHEIYGDGVNLAARLASLAQPGQTVASTQVRQDVADGVHATVHDLGLRFVKHLDEPLRVFRLDPPGPSGPQRHGPATTTDLRPTVAVVPFVAMPPDPDHDALGHALADDVIASLARHPALRVLSRVSTAMLRMPAPDLTHVREALGATFMLTGRFYVQGQRVRLSVELCELATGSVLWTGRTVGHIAELFEGTDELVPHIVTQVSQQIIGHELARARSLPVDSLSSYSLFVGASGLMNSLVKTDFDGARQVLEHLAERHPRHAAPVAMLARWQLFALEQGWTTDRQQAGLVTRELCERALDLDPGSAAAHAVLAQVCANFEGKLQEGRELNERAIALDPSDAFALAQLSGTLAFLGEADAACEAVSESLRLSPLDPSRYVFEAFASMAFVAAGHYARAAAHARSSVRQHSLHLPGVHLLVGALWLNGETDAARRAAQRYLELFPLANSGRTRSRRLGAGLAWRQNFEDALINAGVPP